MQDQIQFILNAWKLSLPKKLFDTERWLHQSIRIR